LDITAQVTAKLNENTPSEPSRKPHYQASVM